MKHWPIALFLVFTFSIVTFAAIPNWTIKEVPPSWTQIAGIWGGVFKGTRGYYVGTDPNSNPVLYEYDFWSETAAPVPGTTGIGQVLDVSDKYILYCTTPSYRSDLWLFDGVNHTMIVPYDEMNGMQLVKVSGEYVSWQHGSGPLGEGIFLYNVAAGTIIQLDDFEHDGFAEIPAIDYPFVVWEEYFSGGHPEPDLASQDTTMVYNIQTGMKNSTCRLLPDSLGPCSSDLKVEDTEACVSFPYVVFIRRVKQYDQDQGKYVPLETHSGLVAMNLQSLGKTQLSFGWWGWGSIAASDGNVIWTQYSIADGMQYLYFWDGSQAVIVPAPGDVRFARIHGSNLLFNAKDNGVYRNYVALVQEPEYHWTSNDDGEWNDPDNWDPDGVPSGGSDTIFDVSSAYTVSNYNHSAFGLRLDSGTLTFDNGQRLKLVNSQMGEYSLIVNSFLNWNAGDLATHNSVIGSLTYGRMMMNGGTWDNHGSLDIADGTMGRLDVGNGAEITLSGMPSNLRVGLNSDGELNILNGGRISAAQGVILGYAPGSTGQVVVRGTNSLLKQTEDMGDGFSIGHEGTGRLRIEQGGRVHSTQSVQIANGVGNLGSVTVEGAGSSLLVTSGTLYPVLVVGSLGDGELTVRDGAQVETDADMVIGSSESGNLGEVLVTGSGSLLRAGMSTHPTPGARWHTKLGEEGSGSLEIRDQAKVELNDLQMADDIGATTADPEFRAIATAYCANINSLTNWSILPGRVKSWLWVKDAEAELKVSGPIYVGWKDSAFILVEDAGWIDCGDLYIGKDDSSTRSGTSASVWVHGDNSTMSMTGHLFISASSDAGDFAGMVVSDQGEVNCDHAYIGKVVAHNTIVGYEVYTRWEPWPGYLRVDGLGSEFHALDTLHVGNGGQAEVDIFNSGKILADTSVEITGLSMTNGGSVYIGTGGIMQAPQVNVREFGHLLGTGTVIGSVHNLGGHVAPGFSPGTLNIQGDYIQDPNGILDIEIGPEDSDILRVTGNVDIQGTVRLSFIRGFAPSAGQSLSFIASPALINLPDVQYEIRNLQEGFLYQMQISDGHVKLMALNDAVYDPTPDLDNDGTVNFKDFALFAQQWNMQSCQTCMGTDLNGDGDVNILDLAILAQHWMKGI